MEVKITQRMNKTLLEEHARFSFNLTWLTRNELFLSIILLVCGIAILTLLPNAHAWGTLTLSIGIIECIKYPTRKSRWVKMCMKRKAFDKIFEFTFTDDAFQLKLQNQESSVPLSDLRSTHIGTTGILLKTKPNSSFYISYNSFQSKEDKESVCNLLSTIVR